MKKYYAVKRGKKPGIYESWKECEANVKSFPNAQYKSFSTYEEAENFLYGRVNQQNLETLSNISNGDMIAYIDGSYEHDIGYYSYAAVIFYDGKKYEYSKRENDSSIVEMRNVAGELKAAMKVMKCAQKLGVKKLLIYYDYAGIEKWVTGEWRAKNHFTQFYREFALKICESIDIQFFKVMAHTGDKYNEEVDKLAKRALYDNKCVTKNDLIEDSNNKSTIYVERREIRELLPISKLTNLNISYLVKDRVITSQEVVKVFKEKWKSMKYKQKDIKEIRVAMDVENKKFIFFIKLEQGEKYVEILWEEL